MYREAVAEAADVVVDWDMDEAVAADFLHYGMDILMIAS